VKIIRHGLSIGIERIDSNFFMTFKAVGKLTHEDYKTMIPMLESAFNSVDIPSIKALVDCSEFEGWELRAAWDDLKLGLKYGKQFDKMAVVGEQKWLEVSSKLASWFMAGEVEHFDNVADAIDWLDV
jgi:hypothetical protein